MPNSKPSENGVSQCLSPLLLGVGWVLFDESACVLAGIMLFLKVLSKAQRIVASMVISNRCSHSWCATHGARGVLGFTGLRKGQTRGIRQHIWHQPAFDNQWICVAEQHVFLKRIWPRIFVFASFPGGKLNQISSFTDSMSCPVATLVQLRRRCFGPRCNSVCWKTTFWPKRGWAFWRTTDQECLDHGFQLACRCLALRWNQWQEERLQISAVDCFWDNSWKTLKNSFEKCFFFCCIGRQDGNAWKCGFLVIIQWSRGPPSTFQWTVAGHLLCGSHQRVASCAGELSPLGSMSKNGCFKYLKVFLKRDPLVIFYTLKIFEVHLVRGISSLWLGKKSWKADHLQSLKPTHVMLQPLHWCQGGSAVRNQAVNRTSSVLEQCGVLRWRRYPWSSIILTHIQIASIKYEIIWAICCIILY